MPSAVVVSIVDGLAVASSSTVTSVAPPSARPNTTVSSPIGDVLRLEVAGAVERVLGVVLVEEDARLALDVAHGVDPPGGAVDLAFVEGDVLLLVGSSSLRSTVPMTMPTRMTNGSATMASTQPTLEGGLPQRPWLGGEDSNLQQPAPKAGVLPVELPPIGHGSGYGLSCRRLPCSHFDADPP